MKKVVAVFALVVAIASVLVSCTPHKQTCAAYNQVEVEQAD
jgi:hypothetical protein